MKRMQHILFLNGRWARFLAILFAVALYLPLTVIMSASIASRYGPSSSHLGGTWASVYHTADGTQMFNISIEFRCHDNSSALGRPMAAGHFNLTTNTGVGYSRDTRRVNGGDVYSFYELGIGTPLAIAFTMSLLLAVVPTALLYSCFRRLRSNRGFPIDQGGELNGTGEN